MNMQNHIYNDYDIIYNLIISIYKNRILYNHSLIKKFITYINVNFMKQN